MAGLDLATAVVSITGDDAPLRHAISGAKAATDRGVNAMQAKLRKLGDTLGRIGRRMTTFVTLPIVGGFVLATKAASDFEEAASKFDAVFKELKGEARAWANDFAKHVGRSRLDIIRWMGSLQDTFVPLGLTRKRSLELSQALVKLGVDVASFQNLTDDEVIRIFTSALTGERESLKRLGVVILEMDVKQEIMRQGWARNTSEITKQMKTEATLNLIMAGTKDAQGDLARTSGSLANQMKRLKGEWTDISVTLGTILIPIAKKLVGVLSDVAGWVQGLSPRSKELILVMAGLAAATGPVLMIMGSLLKLRMAAQFVNATRAAAGLGVAMKGIGGAALGVGVAIAGWQLGKAIGEALELEKIMIRLTEHAVLAELIDPWNITMHRERREAQANIRRFDILAGEQARERVTRTGLKAGESELRPRPDFEGGELRPRPDVERGPSTLRAIESALRPRPEGGLSNLRATEPEPRPRLGHEGGLSKRDSDNLEIIAKSTQKTADKEGGLP